jgi:hypothetical protein
VVIGNEDKIPSGGFAFLELTFGSSGHKVSSRRFLDGHHMG